MDYTQMPDEPEGEECSYVRSLDGGEAKDRAFWWAVVVAGGLLMLLSVNWWAIF